MVVEVAHDVALVVQCQTERAIELPVACACAAKRAQEARARSCNSASATSPPSSSSCCCAHNTPQSSRPSSASSYSSNTSSSISSTTTTTSSSSKNHRLKPAPPVPLTRRPRPARRRRPQATARLAACNRRIRRCSSNLNVSQQLRLLLKRALQVAHARALQLNLQLRSLISDAQDGGFRGSVHAIALRLQLMRAPVAQLHPRRVHVPHRRYNGRKLSHGV